jgi:ribonucleoside-diphosphate reductase beta chain
MDIWLNPDQIQAAAQEIQVTAYKLNSANKDISDDMEFDF